MAVMYWALGSASDDGDADGDAMLMETAMLIDVEDWDDGDGDGAREQGLSLTGSLGPASCSMLGTELGPNQRLSSKIRPCLC